MKGYSHQRGQSKLLIKLILLGCNTLFLLNCKKDKNEKTATGITAQGPTSGQIEDGNSSESNEFLSSPFFLFYQVMEENCISCHNATGLASLADFSVLESEADWVNSDYVQAGFIEESSIYFRLAGSGGERGPKNMPTGGSLSAEQLSVVEQWIASVNEATASSQTVESILEEINQQNPEELSADACRIEMPPQRIWRITRQQYLNIIEDLFDVEVNDVVGDLADPAGIGISTDPASTLSISPERMSTVFDAIEATSERLLANADISTCVSSSGMNCVTNFIDDYGPNLWRRPLSTNEKDSLSQLFSEQLAESSSREASMRLLLESLLISPEFWYRDEIGIAGSGGIAALNDHEIAEFLAFTIWDSIPDTELINLANEQRLSDKNTINSQIKRMAEDPRALRGIKHFIDEWLDLSRVLTVHKNEEHFPDFNASLRMSLWEESMNHVSIAWNENNSVMSLFANSQFLGSPELGAFYDASADSSGALQHQTSERMGILTSGAFLSAHSKAQSTGMPLRGAYFLEEILCSPLPPVPADISADAASGSFTTTREFFENTHANRPECSSCHTILDPIGASFEHYDPIGQYRTLENGYPINATGDLSIAGERFVFNNAIELIQQAVASEKFSQCLIDRYLTHALGWHLEEANCLTQNSTTSSDLKLRDVAEFLERIPNLGERSQTSNMQEQ